MSGGRRPAAFVDRDGTINVKQPEGEYVTAPEQLRLLPGAAEGVRLLNEAGFKVIVITNQRGIALGRMSEGDLAAVHARLREQLAADGARVDALYHCPHAEGTCACRKPEVGLVERALADHADVELEASVVIGDAPSDVEVGRRLGIRTILVGDGVAEAAPGVERVGSLLAAARLVAARP